MKKGALEMLVIIINLVTSNQMFLWGFFEKDPFDFVYETHPFKNYVDNFAHYGVGVEVVSSITLEKR